MVQKQPAPRSVVFRVRPYRDLGVWRELELLESQTLHDLHLAIQDAFELDDDHLYAFYLNNRAFDDQFDYPGPGSDRSSRRAETARLDSLELKLKKRFLYLFDFGDELQHEVQLVRYAEPVPETSYPKLRAGEGEPPPQYPDWDDLDDSDLDDSAASSTDQSAPCVHEGVEISPEIRQALNALIREVDAAMAAFNRAARPWLYADDDGFEDEFEDGDMQPSLREPDELQHDYDLAMQVLDTAQDDLMVIHVVIEHALDQNVIRWLSELPDELSDVGMNAEAVALSERLMAAGSGRALPPARFPLFLARLGQPERARGSMAESLSESPDDPLLLYTAGQVEETLGDIEAAIPYYQQALKWVGSDWALRTDIVHALITLYERTGQTAAGVRLVQQEQQLEQARHERWELPSGTIRSEQPKVGRNEPCPCGSGKKYKKCCGKPS